MATKKNRLQKTAELAVKSSEKLLSQVESIEINSVEVLNTSVEFLKTIKSKFKELEDQRKSATKPINDSLATINGWFKPATDSLKKIEDRMKGKIAAFIESREQEQDQALADGDQDMAIALALDLPNGVSVRHAYTYEITDSDSVPREYCSPDPKKIKATVESTREKTNIPGVRAFRGRTIVVKV